MSSDRMGPSTGRAVGEESSETLSAAFDGECSPEELEELLAQCERSAELRREWSRLSLVRDALSGATVHPKRPCIAASVMSAIGESGPSTKIVPLPLRRRFAWRPAVGLATAATVATVAFYLGYRTPGSAGVELAKAAPPAATAGTLARMKPLAGAQVVAAGSNAPQPAARPVAHSGWDSLPDEDAQQLNTYLIDYSSYRAGAGMPDTLGYARFAAHTAQYSVESASDSR